MKDIIKKVEAHLKEINPELIGIDGYALDFLGKDDDNNTIWRDRAWPEEGIPEIIVKISPPQLNGFIYNEAILKTLMDGIIGMEFDGDIIKNHNYEARSFTTETEREIPIEDIYKKIKNHFRERGCDIQDITLNELKQAAQSSDLELSL